MSRARTKPAHQHRWLGASLLVSGLALLGWAALLLVGDAGGARPALLPALLGGALLLLARQMNGPPTAESAGAGAAGREARVGRKEGPPSDVAPLEIGDAIDLHGFAPRDVVSVVESYLEAAHERGLREVRLIHGRGKGVQRARVQSLLARHPLVERFADAPPSRGGWGATIAWLVPPAQPTPIDIASD